MPSEESLKMVNSVYDESDDGSDHDHHQSHHGNLSRLSVCTSSMCEEDFGMSTAISGLSMEDGDEADVELSDSEKSGKKRAGDRLLELISSDSDKDSGCHSLPGTPPRRRRRPGGCGGGDSTANKSVNWGKDYASENEAFKGTIGNLGRRRRVKRGNSLWLGSRKKEEKVYCYGGESDRSGGGGSGGGGAAVTVITRPRGGGRALCMDMEEVKACRDLGFELEHEKVEFPGRVSISTGSTMDTSSGGNSPIANWQISSPGDDPRDVKARLKMWAQAVALASTSRNGSS